MHALRACAAATRCERTTNSLQRICSAALKPSIYARLAACGLTRCVALPAAAWSALQRRPHSSRQFPPKVRRKLLSRFALQRICAAGALHDTCAVDLSLAQIVLQGTFVTASRSDAQQRPAGPLRSYSAKHCTASANTTHAFARVCANFSK